MIELLQSRLLPEPGAVDGALPQSAVLVLLYETGDDVSVLLTRRAHHLRLHAGEVAFPGGRCDKEDPDAWGTALREANEEVGLPAGAAEFLGYLEAPVTRTGIQVIPCLARLRERVEWQPNPDEIDTVFEAPLSFFADASQLNLDEYVYREKVRGVPRYEFEGYTIWGITAAILVRVVNLALDADLSLEDYWIGVNA